MILDHGIVAARMVGYPVYNDFHSGVMRGSDKSTEIIDTAELGIDALIVIYGIIAAEFAFAVFL